MINDLSIIQYYIFLLYYYCYLCGEGEQEAREATT